MRRFSTYILLPLVSLAASVYAAGWTVDLNSCKDPELQQQIRESMKWVFDRADDAVEQLSKNPINQDVCNLDYRKGSTNVGRCVMFSILSGLSMTLATINRPYRRSNVSAWSRPHSIYIADGFRRRLSGYRWHATRATEKHIR